MGQVIFDYKIVCWGRNNPYGLNPVESHGSPGSPPGIPDDQRALLISKSHSLMQILLHITETQTIPFAKVLGDDP